MAFKILDGASAYRKVICEQHGKLVTDLCGSLRVFILHKSKHNAFMSDSTVLFSRIMHATFCNINHYMFCVKGHFVFKLSQEVKIIISLFTILRLIFKRSCLCTNNCLQY